MFPYHQNHHQQQQQQQQRVQINVGNNLQSKVNVAPHLSFNLDINIGCKLPTIFEAEITQRQQKLHQSVDDAAAAHIGKRQQDANTSSAFTSDPLHHQQDDASLNSSSRSSFPINCNNSSSFNVDSKPTSFPVTLSSLPASDAEAANRNDNNNNNNNFSTFSQPLPFSPSLPLTIKSYVFSNNSSSPFSSSNEGSSLAAKASNPLSIPALEKPFSKPFSNPINGGGNLGNPSILHKQVVDFDKSLDIIDNSNNSSSSRSNNSFSSSKIINGSDSSLTMPNNAKTIKKGFTFGTIGESFTKSTLTNDPFIETAKRYQNQKLLDEQEKISRLKEDKKADEKEVPYKAVRDRQQKLQDDESNMAKKSELKTNALSASSTTATTKTLILFKPIIDKTIALTNGQVDLLVISPFSRDYSSEEIRLFYYFRKTRCQGSKAIPRSSCIKPLLLPKS